MFKQVRILLPPDAHQFIISIRNNNPNFSGFNKIKEGRKDISDYLRKLINSRDREQLRMDCNQPRILEMCKPNKDKTCYIVETISEELYQELKAMKFTGIRDKKGSRVKGISLRNLIMLMYDEAAEYTNIVSAGNLKKEGNQPEQMYKCVIQEAGELSKKYNKTMRDIIKAGYGCLISAPEELNKKLLQDISFENKPVEYSGIAISPAMNKAVLLEYVKKYGVKNKSWIYMLILRHYKRMMDISYPEMRE